jgi:hypothetical protein
MFARLFAESGLSLDRLRALLEVGAAGSIVKAAEGDPVLRLNPHAVRQRDYLTKSLARPSSWSRPP